MPANKLDIAKTIDATLQGGWHAFYTNELSAERAQSGATSNFHCPNKEFHKNNDQSPSLSINNDNSTYFCHTCGISGNWISWMKTVLNVQDPIMEMAKRFHIDMNTGTIPQGAHEAIRKFVSEQTDKVYGEWDASGVGISDEEKGVTSRLGDATFTEKLKKDYENKRNQQNQKEQKPNYVPEDWIQEKHEHLKSKKYDERLAWLQREKGISADVVDKYQIGFDPHGDDEKGAWERQNITSGQSYQHNFKHWQDRYIFPVRDADGKCLNVKRYRTDAELKTLPYRKSEEKKGLYYPSGVLFPKDNLASSTIYWYEGETDMYCALSHGINAVTTGGSTSFGNVGFEQFKGKKVVLIFDIDQSGRLGANKLAAKLVDYVAEVKIIKLERTHESQGEDHVNPTGLNPEKYGRGDFINFMKENNWSIDVFDDLVKNTKAEKINPQDRAAQKRYRVSLTDTINPMYYEQPIEFMARVAEVQESQYFQYPIAATFKCERSDSSNHVNAYCKRCPALVNKWYLEEDHVFDLSKASYREILSMIDTNDNRKREAISGVVGVPSKCTMIKYTAKKVGRIYGTVLTPDQDESAEFDIKEDKFDKRGINPHFEMYGYIKTLSINVKANKTYLFSGMQLNHPSNQATVVFIDKVSPMQNSIEGFVMDNERANLLSIFQCDYSSPDAIERRLHNIYHEFENMTGVIGRRDLFLICDLILHSMDTFSYEQSPLLKRGWVEGIVLGQSRTAKTYVAKFLNHHYKMGEFLAANISTRSGLIGGSAVTKSGKRHIKWGAFPRNNKGAVIIDEFSSVGLEMIKAMIDMRTSGKAQISGINEGVVDARVRQLALSNPRREGRDAYIGDEDMQNGIRELQKLFMNIEQALARYDIALCVKRGDVDSADFIKRFHKTPNNNYTSLQCQTLIKWCWSRRSENVKFTEDAYDAIRRYSKVLTEKYHGSGGLITESETHVKLARLSGALAGRLFSTSKDSEYNDVIIRGDHVEYIYQKLDSFYSDKNMGYDTYSYNIKKRFHLGDINTIMDALQDCDMQALLTNDNLGLHMLKVIFEPHIRKRLEADQYKTFRVTDSTVANEIAHKLQKINAITQNGYAGYRKTRPFTEWLEERVKATKDVNKKEVMEAIKNDGSDAEGQTKN